MIIELTMCQLKSFLIRLNDVSSKNVIDNILNQNREVTVMAKEYSNAIGESDNVMVEIWGFDIEICNPYKCDVKSASFCKKSN